MRGFLYKLPQTIAKCFSPKNLLWHICAIGITYILVVSGFDWIFFTHAQNPKLNELLFPAVILGGLLPVFVPLVVLVVGMLKKSVRTLQTAYALGQAGIAGWLISSFYKVFTGRVPPPSASVLSFMKESVQDISHTFQFGFMRGGIFWGWPSSHTTVAVAMAVVILVLYKNKKVRFVSLLYALYVGLGVAISIHWFTDFIAGIIFGSIIGIVVGNSFRERHMRLQNPLVVG